MLEVLVKGGCRGGTRFGVKGAYNPRDKDLLRVSSGSRSSEPGGTCAEKNELLGRRESSSEPLTAKSKP